MNFLKVLTLMTLTSTAFASAAADNNLKSILQKPLIVGASVSGDHYTASPGKRLALRYTDQANIKVIAGNGRSGREVLKSVSSAILKDRSVIIGMDLFFWDSFSASTSESFKALDGLLEMARAQNIPVVLGEIPQLMPHRQTSAEALNQRIKQACQAYSECRILPLNEMLKKTLEDGYLVLQGKKYTLDKLLPDGLHIVTPASEHLADEIEKLLI